jgi:hypothetical protein
MAGYSGTPLPKKLGIKPGCRVYVANAPAEVRAELLDALAQCEVLKRAEALDFAILFRRSRAELSKEFLRISRTLNAAGIAGMFWISWPKKSSGVATDLTGDDVRAIGLDAGLVDVKVCAVSEIWSGLKFVRRIKDRKGIRV